MTHESNALTLRGFLAQWTMTTLLDFKITLAYLAYLGYSGPTTEALMVKDKTFKKKGNTRNVFSCFVIGPPGSGKVVIVFI